MPVLQQVEEVRRPEVARLQAMAVLEDLLFRQGVVSRRVHAAEEVKDGGLRPRLEIPADVLYLRFLGIRQHARLPLPVEADLVEGVLEQRIHCHGDEQVEAGNRGEIQQGRGHRPLQVPERLPHFPVQIVRVAFGILQIEVADIEQAACSAWTIGIHAQPPGQLAREVLVQRRPARRIRPNGKFLPDDDPDLPVVDVGEQIAPVPLGERLANGSGRQAVHASAAKLPESAASLDATPRRGLPCRGTARARAPAFSRGQPPSGD